MREIGRVREHGGRKVSEGGDGREGGRERE